MPTDTKGERYNIQCPYCGAIGQLRAEVSIKLENDVVVYFQDPEAWFVCDLKEIRCGVCGESGLEEHYYEHTEMCNCARH